MCVYFSAQGIYLYSSPKYANKIILRCCNWNPIQSMNKKNLENSNMYRNRVCTFHYIIYEGLSYILLSLTVFWYHIGFHYITRYCSRNFHYVSKRDKKEKNTEIIVLGKRREVIGRMALEPCNYPAILSLSERRKLAKQTWNGHYVFPISALTSK